MKISDIVTLRTESVTPVADTHYHLYSLPSFDNNQCREEVCGNQIQSNKYAVPNRCILFNKLNVRFKRVWRIDNPDPNKLCSTEFLPLVVNEDIADYNFCYYLLISDYISNYLEGQNLNTSNSHKRIDPSDFFNIGISIPTKLEQEKIGRILSTIDNKIALNRALNHNLEAMAKQLYDYWFVQFDFPNADGKPYKSCGGKMVWNETLKREIPNGWEIIAIRDILDKVPNTQRVETSLYEKDGDIPIIDQSREYIVGYTNDERTIISKIPAIVFGDHTRIVKLVNFEFARGADGTQILYSNNDRLPIHLLYLQVMDVDLSNRGYARHFKFLKESPIILPAKNVSQQFEEICKQHYMLISSNIKEITHLTKLRDELLPLLMNGQVSVNYDL